MDRDRETRKRLASLPFSDKLKILQKLRDRSRLIAAAGLRRTAAPQHGRDVTVTTLKRAFISDKRFAD